MHCTGAMACCGTGHSPKFLVEWITADRGKFWRLFLSSFFLYNSTKFVTATAFTFYLREEQKAAHQD